ncbi:MAG: hypothetical protein Aurels2KO_05620 [Aureliella sp.]
MQPRSHLGSLTNGLIHRRGTKLLQTANGLDIDSPEILSIKPSAMHAARMLTLNYLN